jgi:putative hydrolase of the HAD superfamily
LDLEGLGGICFDLGSTLVYRTVSEEESFFRIGQEVGLEFPDDRTLRRGLRAGRHYYNQHYPECRTRAQEEALCLGRIQATLEPMHSREVARRVVRAIVREVRDYPRWWAVYEDALPCLRAAREAGLRLALISNWLPSLPEFCRALELDGLFDTLVCSRVEGMEKPAPELFHIAAQRLGLAPSQCLHVGDSYSADVQGALSAGLRAVMLDRNDAFPHPGTARVRSLSELTAHLPAPKGLRG